MSRIGIGIDFGTTNTAAAVYDGERVSLVELDAPSQIMPSATYIDSELQTLTGQAAIDRYIADNVGRTVELVSEVVGESTLMVGDPDPEGRRPVETLTQKVYGRAGARLRACPGGCSAASNACSATPTCAA